MLRKLISRKIVGAIFISIGLISLNTHGGEIYKWTDADGVVHFGDSPPESAIYSIPDIKVNSYSAPPIPDRGTINDNQVVMYGTSWCGYCKKAKNYFAKKGIPFKEFDIEKSSAARREYDQLNGRGVPLIIVGNQRLSGFTIEAFERIYQ
ncbi:MAG: glutaredoxin family protein [Acidiferrobacterales bacterium]|nr:glutaredoxin family protein [Acidiferrobacterales bacterium]